MILFNILKIIYVNFCILTILLFSACSQKDETAVPDHIAALENLVVFPPDSAPSLEIKLSQKLRFETVNGTPFTPGGITVDGKGRVYISDISRRSVHIFEKDGSYLMTIGREGSGPGEFRSPPSPKIVSDKLYLFDAVQSSIAVYNLDSLTYSHSIIVHGDWDGMPGLAAISSDEKLLMYTADRIHSNPDDPRYNLESDRFSYYYLVDSDGVLRQNEPVFKLREPGFLIIRSEGMTRGATNRPYQTRSLLALSNNDYFYKVPNTKYLLFKIYNPEGEYKHSFYYPFENKSLTYKEALEVEPHERIRNSIRTTDVPTFWPALKTMLFDDKNRIWISTIIDDYSVHKWLVLDDQGTLLTSLVLPSRYMIEEVKNNHIYIRSVDEMGVVTYLRFHYRIIEV